MTFVEQLVTNRIVKLKGDNEVLVRQIPFLAQRLDDYKATLKANLVEIADLQTFLSATTAAQSVSTATESTGADSTTDGDEPFRITRTPRTYPSSVVVE